MLKNVRSKLILMIIFNNIKFRRKLIMVKHNKILLIKLNITNEDFKLIEELKLFNKKYKTNIEDINTNELNLSDKEINNEELENLNIYKFKKFKILDLTLNQISNIKPLKNFKLENLKKLNLHYNDISDINIIFLIFQN